jgi:hypothetical protein
MNTNTRNSRILNSILPATNSGTPGMYISGNSSEYSYMIPYIVGGILVLVVAGLIYMYNDQFNSGWDSLMESIKVALYPPVPVPAPTPVLEERDDVQQSAVETVVEKVLPNTGQQVFNVSSNKFTYYDAEPLCKALGAELATYDQVKEAWSKGADWCNYGWVKGQMAVYPTSQSTYDKVQAGPNEGRTVCGQPGVNGGYFDNPELRYGVTCYGKKPSENLHNTAQVTLNAPLSPDALEYEKKVNKFKQEASTIAILPNNSTSWN